MKYGLLRPALWNPGRLVMEYTRDDEPRPHLFDTEAKALEFARKRYTGKVTLFRVDEYADVSITPQPPHVEVTRRLSA